MSGALALDAQLGGHGLAWLEDLCLPQGAEVPSGYEPMAMKHNNHAALFLAAALGGASGALYLSGTQGNGSGPTRAAVEAALLAMISRVAIATEKPDVVIAQQVFNTCSGRQIDRRQIVDALLSEYRSDEGLGQSCPFGLLAGTSASAKVLSAGFATGHALGTFPEMAIRAMGTAARAMGLNSRDVEQIYVNSRPRELAQQVISRARLA